MNVLSTLSDFLNNGSVSAFLGAAAAFLLVALTDRCRRHRKKRVFDELVASTLDLSKRKAQNLTTNRDLLRNEETVHPGEVQKYPSAEIDMLKIDLLDMMSSEERFSLEGLVFKMKGTDNLLELLQRTAERLYELYLHKEVGDESERVKKELLVLYEAVLTNIEQLEELGDLFLAKKFEEMADWRYKLTPSEGLS